MSEEIVICAAPGETRIARVSAGAITGLMIDRTLGDMKQSLALGDIVLGRVVEVSPSNQAAFVALPFGETGLLPVRDARGLGPDKAARIESLVHEGESIVVQVSRLAIDGKGPRVSADLAFPGRFLVFGPRRATHEISRRIDQKARREALSQLAAKTADGGLMVRTAARNVDDRLIEDEASRLVTAWQATQQGAKTATAPVLLWHDADPVERALRDWGSPNLRTVHTDDPRGVPHLEGLLKRFGLDEAVTVRTVKERAGAFRHRDLEEQVHALAEPRVPLVPAGWITIERTEALTAVDVNAGGDKAMSAESGRLAVNLRAAEAIARQIVLRDIGGLIVVDFLDLAQPENKAKVLKALREGFRGDAAPLRLGAFSEFGTVELSRRRTGQDISALLNADCAECEGSGRRNAPDMNALVLLRHLAQVASQGAIGAVHVSKPLEDWLNSHRPRVDALLEDFGLTMPPIVVEPNWSGDLFEIKPATS